MLHMFVCFKHIFWFGFFTAGCVGKPLDTGTLFLNKLTKLSRCDSYTIEWRSNNTARLLGLLGLLARTAKLIGLIGMLELQI